MNRPPLLAVFALQALLVAAVVRPDGHVPDDVDPAVLRANNDIWQTLPDTERDVLRARWARFVALPAAEQQSLLQRADALSRLGANLAQRQGRAPTAEESVAELTRIVDGARQIVQRPGAPVPTDAEVHQQMETRTRRSIQVFLDNLTHHGHISAQDAARMRNQPLADQVRDSLLLLKAEEIGLYSEGVKPDEADRLLPLAPLDVAAQADSRRQQVGFLGRLGQAVPMTEADRKALEGLATPQERKERLRDLEAPAIRRLLAAHGTPADRIDELLTTAPINELERAAHEILKPPAATPAAATPEPVAPPH